MKSKVAAKVTIKEIIQFIDEELNRKMKVSVNEITTHFNITREWLRILFYKECNRSPHEYIHKKESICWERYRKLNPNEPIKSVIYDIKISRCTLYRRMKKLYQIANHHRKYFGTDC